MEALFESQFPPTHFYIKGLLKHFCLCTSAIVLHLLGIGGLCRRSATLTPYLHFRHSECGTVFVSPLHCLLAQKEENVTKV